MQALFLIRARTDRQLVPEDSEGNTRILEALASAPVLGALTVEIPSNGKRQARTASVEVRVAHVTIKPPQRRGHAKASAFDGADQRERHRGDGRDQPRGRRGHRLGVADEPARKKL